MGHENSLLRYLMTLAACFIIIAGLRVAQGLVVPFLLAAFIAVILAPLLHWLEAKGIGTPVALLLIVSGCILISVWFSIAVGNSINEFSGRFVELPALIDEKVGELEKWLHLKLRVDSELPSDATDDSGSTDDGGSEVDSDPKPAEDGTSVPDQPPAPEVRETATEPAANASTNESSADDGPTSEEAETATSHEETASSEPHEREADDSEPSTDFWGTSLDAAPSTPVAPDSSLLQPAGFPTTDDSLSPRSFDIEARAMSYLRSVLSGLANLLSNALIILITVIFMLLEASRIPAKLKAAFGTSHPLLANIKEIIDDVRRYMVIKTTTSALTGISVVALSLLLDIPYGLLWGVVAFLFNFVPNIGSIIAAIPPILLALVEPGQGPMQAGAIAFGYVVINSVISYAIEPRYMGQGLGLSTLVVFLSLIFWGWVLGPVGMLLSAPLTMIVKIVLMNSDDTRWLAILMSSKAPAEPAPAMEPGSG